MNRLKRIVRSDVFLPIVCFCIYFVWSVTLPWAMAPDEVLRLKIPFYIYDHGTLPFGTEEEIRDFNWGLSYGFVPYGSSLVAALLMKMVSFFNASYSVLMLAARFTSVVFGTATVYCCEKIAPFVFQKRSSKYLFAILCGFLPQFAFLSSYFNCDAMAVFSSSLIVLCWMNGIENGWDGKRCVALGIALGVCALSYYYAYGFILLSIPVFIVSYVHQQRQCPKKKACRTLGLPLLVFASALAVAGWFFIRAGVLYGGDIFGLSIQQQVAQTYAETAFKPSDIVTPQSSGVSVLCMLTGIGTDDYFWLWHTGYSFFAAFGGTMTLRAPLGVYAVYFAVCLCFLAIGLWRGFGNSHNVSRWISAAFAAAVIIPCVLSVFYSFTSDYQPQGRYIMSGVIPMMVFVVWGVESAQDAIDEMHSRGKMMAAPKNGLPGPSIAILKKNAVAVSLGIVYMILFVVVVHLLVVPYAVCLWN